MSLNDLADAYAESTTTSLYMEDAARAHAYANAATLGGPTEYDRRQLNLLLDQCARTLDAAALARAEADGRRIYENCCIRH